VLAQSGIQSAVHPSSDCRSPATVTDCGEGVLAWSAAGSRERNARARTRGLDIGTSSAQNLEKNLETSRNLKFSAFPGSAGVPPAANFAFKLFDE
jgi:hypothetical protein